MLHQQRFALQRSMFPLTEIAMLPFASTSKLMTTLATSELPAVSLDTVLFREAGGQTAWKVMERR